MGTRCVGYLSVSEWFNPFEPPRTFSNHFSAEKERCVEVFDVSSELFDCTEPSRTSSSQWNKVCRVPVHYFRMVQPQRTSSNLLEPLQCRESKVHFFGENSGRCGECSLFSIFLNMPPTRVCAATVSIRKSVCTCGHVFTSKKSGPAKRRASETRDQALCRQDRERNAKKRAFPKKTEQ